MKSDLELLNSSEEDLKWIQYNLDSIQENFSNMIIAVKNKEIIASGKNIREILISLDKKGVDSSEMIIERVIPKNEIIIL